MAKGQRIYNVDRQRADLSKNNQHIYMLGLDFTCRQLKKLKCCTVAVPLYVAVKYVKLQHNDILNIFQIIVFYTTYNYNCIDRQICADMVSVHP